jgi:hypothetical protein
MRPASRLSTAAQWLARWLFLFALIEGPWLYGSTRPWTFQLLHNLLFASILLNLPAFLRDRFQQRRGVPILPVLCLVLLAAQAYGMWFNARSYLDDSFWEFVPILQPYPGLPGSWDRAATFPQFETILALLAAFLMAIDLAESPTWRNRLWHTMAFTGFSVVVFGLVERALSAPSMYWRNENDGNVFFGTFRYHGNAGAFLNLVWPVILLLLLRSFRRPRAHLERAFWACALFLTVVAAMVNISRAAGLITIVLGLFAGVWLVPQARTRQARFFFRRGAILVVLLAGFAAALIMVSGHSPTQSHWRQLATQLNGGNQRLLTADACLRMLPEAGWFGFGPGTFSAVFPFHTAYLERRIYGFWVYAHEDYLQTVIEYGKAGAALWSIYFLGGIFAALVRAFRTKAFGVTSALGYAACFLALTGIALHALVDFPLQVPSIQVYVAVYLALAWRSPGREGVPAEEERAARGPHLRPARAVPGVEPA